MSRGTIAEQVRRHYYAEREAISAEAPDVTPERARLIRECQEAGDVDHALGEPARCVCGSGHRWGAA